MHPTPAAADFILRKEKAEAFGRSEGRQFIVLAGSTATRDGSPNVKRDRVLRDKLVQQNILVEHSDPELFVFAKDYAFESASRAAGVVIDGNSNGSQWIAIDTSDVLQGNGKHTLTYDQIEAAFDRIDELGPEGIAENYPQLGEPREYWVRSTSKRNMRRYPSKLVVAIAREVDYLNGGWSSAQSAAAVLYNSGFIIVDDNDSPLSPKEARRYFISISDRIRLCAQNYYIYPARERGDHRVTIRAGEIHDAMGLSKNWANVCQVLAGKKFQKAANLMAPRVSGPKASTTTTFTFELSSNTAMVRNNQSKATNLILYGPPGTGKTYRTALEAVRLCDRLELDDPIIADASRRNDLMERYRELVELKRIEFVTFHQSYSYEEFVEGLRPTTEREIDTDDEADLVLGAPSGGFRLVARNGVFKSLCERARLDTGGATKQKRLDRTRAVFKVALGSRWSQEDRIEEGIQKGLIHQGWGGEIDWSDEKFDDFEAIRSEWNTKVDPNASGKDANIELTYAFRSNMQVGDYVVVPDGRDAFRAFGRVTGEYFYDKDAKFHPHRRQVEWIWQDKKGRDRAEFYPNNFRRHSVYRLAHSQISWDPLEEIVLGTDAKRPSSEARDYVLIADEINRANISKVFGELITLLEPDKRLGSDNEIRLRLPYSGAVFGVPSNLHIIGTMNTADRSIALLDTALRRRFKFREMMPEPELLPENVSGINLRKMLKVLNERIEYLFDREHQIGHAYFISCGSKQAIEQTLRDNIIPLLCEYFYEDWEKVALVLGEDIGKDEFKLNGKFLNRKLLSLGSNTDLMGERYRWAVNEHFDFTEFAAE